MVLLGPNVTAPQVLANLDVIANRLPALKYVQIDDGYQSAMGDWLETGRAFEGNVRAVLTEIRRRGFEPAIWVAPFVAETGSMLFQQHPDYFIRDAASDLTDAECQFHATAVYATGGMVLSGDDLTALPPARAVMLRKLLPATGVAAEFQDTDLNVGFVRLPSALMVCLFNWDDRVRTLSFPIPRPSDVTDYWTAQSLGRRTGIMSLDLEARSARLLQLASGAPDAWTVRGGVP